VDELMTSIAQRAGNIDASRVAVLACLHLADRLRGIERELAHLKARVNDKSRQFSVLLDSAIE
jgi:cell division protein ZapA